MTTQFMGHSEAKPKNLDKEILHFVQDDKATLRFGDSRRTFETNGDP